jgi:hypothetical protein
VVRIYETVCSGLNLTFHCSMFRVRDGTSSTFNHGKVEEPQANQQSTLELSSRVRDGANQPLGAFATTFSLCLELPVHIVLLNSCSEINVRVIVVMLWRRKLTLERVEQSYGVERERCSRKPG